MKRFLIPSFAATAAMLVFFTAALAAGYTLFGDATNVPGGVQLRSDPGHPPGYGGIAYVPSSPLTLGGLTTLSASMNITQGGCGGGSPRFTIATPSGNVFVYVGPAPSYVCGTGPINTGNLLAPGPGNFCDTSQLPGGTFYDQCSRLQTNPAFSMLSVTEIDFVVDGSFAVPGGVQTVIVSNLTINGATFPPPPSNCVQQGGNMYCKSTNPPPCYSVNNGQFICPGNPR